MTTPPPAAQAADPRSRLLDAAAKLFYEQGVNIGIAALCAEARVSKRSMYQYFESKDDVIAASLARSVPDYLRQLLPDPADERAPRDRILAVFDNVERIAADPGFRGCPYVSIASEIKSVEHPARKVTRDFHDTLTGFFRDSLAQAGDPAPDRLAQQLTAVHDGVLAGTVVQGRPLTGVATAMATTLLGTVDQYTQEAVEQDPSSGSR